jgi:hypothetical protein
VSGGLSPWTCLHIDQGYGEVSLVSYNGVPSIAYYDRTGGNLRFATNVGPSATYANCGKNTNNHYAWRCDAIEAIGAGLTHASVSMTLDAAGLPAIAYQKIPDLGPAALRLARPIGAYNIDPGNCGPPPYGGIGFEPNWWCSTVDGGGADTDEADFTGIGLQPKGLAVIAYTEDDNYNYASRLMVARQQIFYAIYLPFIKK